MANRTLYPVRAHSPGKALLTFGIAPNGVGTPTIVEDSLNAVASVSRSGVGVLAIVLADTYVAVAGIQTQLQLSAAADTQVQITGAATVTTTKTITITILTAGVAGDIAANAANVIWFTVWMRDSSVT